MRSRSLSPTRLRGKRARSSPMTTGSTPTHSIIVVRMERSLQKVSGTARPLANHSVAVDDLTHNVLRHDKASSLVAGPGFFEGRAIAAKLASQAGGMKAVLPGVDE